MAEPPPLSVSRITWRGRYLTRQGVSEGPGLCEPSPRTPIPDTPAGDTVQVSVWLAAPSLPGSCRVDWKMTDAEGREYFPNLQGVYVIVNIKDAP